MNITATYTYNGDGDRYAQTVGGITTDYVLDPVGLAQVLLASRGAQDDFYLPGLAQYDTAWSYYLPDRLGSVRQLVDSTSAVQLTQSFDPFGNVFEQTGAGQSRFGYTGEQTDPTDLIFLRARYYDPAVGRFLTADSIVPDPMSSGGWNRYAYVGNNPVIFADPSGHQCIMVEVAGGAIERGIDCLGGGGPAGSARGIGTGGLSGGKMIGAGAAGVAVGGIGVVIANDPVETFPLEAPDLGTPPGFTLTQPDKEAIVPCGEDSMPPLPPFGLLDDPLGDVFYGTPLERPGVLDDNILQSTTSRGIKRNNPGYFKKLLKKYPDILGEESKDELKAGRMPYVDQNWIQYFPEHAPYLGEKLTVHHVSGFVEKPIPRSQHPDHHSPGGYRYNPGEP